MANMLRSASESSFPLSPAWTGLISDKVAVRQVPSLPRAGWVEDAKHQLAAGQVLMPSAGLANDSTRARNTGRRLGLQFPTSTRLTKSSSETQIQSPNPKSGKSNLPSAGLQGIRFSPVAEPKTPRTLRGTVRKNSAVLMSYPAFPGLQNRTQSAASSCVVRWCGAHGLKVASGDKSQTDSDPLLLEGCKKEAQASSRPNSSASTKRAHKRVSWADKIDSDASTTNSETSEARVRSMMLLDNLYKLRRVGGSDSPTKPAIEAEAEVSAAAAEQDEQHMTLMSAVLTGVNDTESDLRVSESQLQAAQDPVQELGGSRHATTLVSARTLSVVQRKADLLKVAEAALAGFEAAHAKREELRVGIIDGAETVPQGYQGVKAFIGRQVHKDLKGCVASPMDADKTHFEMFASSFGLPAEHESLVRLKQLAHEATEWWADATLQTAWTGADAFVLQRMINVTKGFLNITRHDKLDQVSGILGDRLCEKCLASAQRIQQKDAQIVARSAAPQPASAREGADQIDQEIRQAVAQGAPPKHGMLAEAKRIAVELHMEEKNRFALQALRFAQKMQEKDAAMAAAAEREGQVPPVGPASEAADGIEREIRDAMKKGSPEAHDHLLAAKSIAKHLRDEDGQRKRMAAREKRISAKSHVLGKVE